MREIKFRAWRRWGKGKECAEMLYLPNSELFRGLESGLLRDEYTVMQYTGLTDKNGKEIYEGDITNHITNHGVIIWNENECSFNTQYIYKNRKGFKEKHEISAWDIKNYPWEVIGNIYANPGLVTE